MARSPHLDLPDLTGRRVVLTGASDGIGLGMATRFAAAGADLVLPVRNPAKGEAALATIRAAVSHARVTLGVLDLASQASIAAFAASMAPDQPIHVLVNNAGVMTPPERRASEDGHELQLATNHLGPAALVTRLLPQLRAGRARVVAQISIAARRGAVHWDDLDWTRSYDRFAAYRSSKIAQGLFALELHRRSEAHGWGLTSLLSHPGVAPTNLLAAQPDLGRDRETREIRVIRRLSRIGVVGTPDSAGLPALYAATSPDAVGGRMYGPRGLGQLAGAPTERRLFPALRADDDARRVWDETLRMTGTQVPDAASRPERA